MKIFYVIIFVFVLGLLVYAATQGKMARTAETNITRAPEIIQEPAISEEGRDEKSLKKRLCFSQKNIGDEVVKLTIAAQMQEKIIGVAFDTEFSADKISFLAYKKGDFFEKGGEPLYLTHFDQNKSRVIAGVTLKRGDQLQSGRGTIINYYFKRVRHGAKTEVTTTAAAKAEEDLFSFSNTVVSTLENGARKNLLTTWQACPSEF